jgi:hypothetical protein
LVEGVGERGGFTGRTERNEIVHLEANGDPTGEFLRVEIVAAFKHSLAGLPLDARWRSAGGAATGPNSRSPRSLPLVQ